MYLAKIAVYIERSQHTCNGSRGMHHNSWGRRHQIEVSKAHRTRSLLTFVSQDMLLVVRPPRLTCNGACAHTARCVYPPPPSLRRRTAAPDTAALCEMRPLCYSRRCVRKAKKDAPAAVVSRAACVSRAPPAHASRLALSGWGRPPWSLRVNILLIIAVRFRYVYATMHNDEQSGARAKGLYVDHPE